MIRFRARSLAAVVGAAALVAVSALPAGAKTSSPEKWGAAFCGGLSEWSDTVTTGASDISASVARGTTPGAGKAIIIGFIGDIGDATGDFFTAVKKAGTPDTTNGAKIRKEILKGISGIESRVGGMADLAEGLPTTDVTSFQTSVQALSSAFDTVATPFDSAMTKVASLDKGDDLSDALQDVKECKALF